MIGRAAYHSPYFLAEVEKKSLIIIIYSQDQKLWNK